MSDFIGPTLPPHLRRDSEDKNEDDVLTAEISDDEYREDIPTKPPDLPEDAYGPALPPGFKPSTIGPAPPLPSSPKSQSTSKNSVEVATESDDEDIVGPMPIGSVSDSVKQQLEYQLESRAHKMKEKLAGKDNEDDQKIKRESWMLELPPEKAVQFGLGPRQFRMRENAATGDRSVWTDTPELREKKASEKPVPADDLRRKAVEDRDEQMEKLTEGCSKKRSKESLLESHQKKLKREKKESSGGKQERRPFDRNIDLQANRFDEAQKKAIFKKAQMLDDRFSRGESKYL